MNRKLQIMLLLLLGASSIFAQGTVGRNFWVTLLPNGDDEHSQAPMEPELRIVGERPCSGTVTHPFSGWSESFAVAEGVATIISVPLDQAYAQEASDCVLETALHIETSDAVSVFVADYRRGSFDISCALPVPSLGSDYLVQTFHSEGDQEGERAVLSIIAVEDNTTIDLLLNCDTKNGHHAHEPFSVTLQAGQCYQLQSAFYGSFCGSRISVRNEKQKIAVFAGNRSVSVPSNATMYLDHAQEQMMPISALGRRFILTQSLQRERDWVRVTTLKDHCEIRRDGVLIGTINTNHYFDFPLSADAPASFIETSEPALVGLYLQGCGDPWSNGDPALVFVRPIEQQTESANFCTFRTTYSQLHFVNIVTETDKVSGMRLDTVDISSQFSVVPSRPEYAYARIPLPNLQNGTHRIQNTAGGFLAHVYGFGHYEGYAFSPGSMVLTSELRVNDTPEWEHPEGFDAGVDETINFRLLANYELSEAHWDFGDGQTETTSGPLLQHGFSSEGDYRVTCDLYRQGQQGQQVFAGRVSTIIHVGTDGLGESADERFCFYPNPGKDVLSIRTAVTMWQPYTARVEIYDLAGKLIYNQEIIENITSINAGAWSAGTYIWKVYTNQDGPSTGSGTLVETGKWIKE